MVMVMVMALVWMLSIESCVLTSPLMKGFAVRLSAQVLVNHLCGPRGTFFCFSLQKGAKGNDEVRSGRWGRIE